VKQRVDQKKGINGELEEGCDVKDEKRGMRGKKKSEFQPHSDERKER